MSAPQKPQLTPVQAALVERARDDLGAASEYDDLAARLTGGAR